MNLNKLENFTLNRLDINVSKYILTGIISILFLSFSFGQTLDIKQLIDEIKDGGSKREKSFLLGLDSIYKQFKKEFDNNCTAKLELYRNYGAHYYYYPKQIDKSLEYFQDSAIALAQKCEEIDYDYYVQTLINTDSALKKKGDLKRRNQHIEFLKNELDDSVLKNDSINAKAYYQIGKYYNEILKLDRANVWLQRSLAYYNSKEKISEFALRAMDDYASNLTKIEKHQESIKLFLKVRKYAEALNIETKTRYNENLYSNLANAYERNNQIDSAKIYYNKFFEIAKKSKSALVQSNIYEKKSSLNFYEKEYDKALFNINNAIEIVESAEDGLSKSRLQYYYTVKSILLNTIGQHQLALETSFLSMNSSSYGLSDFSDNNSVLENIVVHDPYTYLEGAIEYFKAYIALNKLESEKIINLWKVFEDQFYEIQRQSYGNINKNSFPPLHHNLCQELLDYIFSNDLQDKYYNIAAYCISNSKSIPLYESISENELLPKQIQDKYQKINNQQAEIYSQLAIAELSEKTSDINNLFEKNYELNQKKIEIYNEINTLGVDINFNNHRESFVTQAQSSLDEPEGIIEFFYGDKYIYRYALSSKKIKLDRFTNFNIYNTDFTSAFTSSQNDDIILMDQQIDTFSILFSELEWGDEIKDLLIIPDGKLFYIPFDVLRYEDKNLLQQFNVNYQFALKIDTKENSNKTKNRMNYIGFGTEYNDSELERINHSERIYIMFRDSFNLSKLPKAEEEITSLSNIFGGKEYLSSNCTSERFYENAPFAKILHISNHVLLNEINSDLSSILFSSEDSISLVNTLDIQRMNLSADLAILSSCNSGTGQFLNGVGIRSLGYSFTKSGCPSVIVNLWEASDKSSNFIITRFAENLKRGAKKSNALRMAKLDYLESVGPALQHPKYWANIILIGSDEPIEFSITNSNYINYLQLGALLVVISLLGYIILKRLPKKDSPF